MNKQKYFVNGNFGEVYEKYFSELVRFANKYTHCVEDSKDVAQNAMLCAFEKKDQFRGGEKEVRAWLYRIVINTKNNFFIKNAAKKRSFEKAPPNIEIPYYMTPERILLNKEIKENSLNEIYKRNKIHWALLKSYFFKENSDSMVAKELGIGREKVKSAIFEFKKTARINLATLLN